MPSVTVTSGGPDIPDGVYPVTLADITGDPTDPSKPKSVLAKRGPKAGEYINLWDWKFLIDEGDYEGTPLYASTSDASGPKSKMYAYLTALFGGKAPAIGTKIDFADLKARRALATVKKDDEGYVRIDNLGAMPASMLAAGVARVTGAPLKGLPAAPVAVGTAVGPTDELPF